MDLDIDTVTLLCSDFDNNGKYILSSPYGSLESTEMLKASWDLPFPTGITTTREINNNKPSYFITYKNLLGTLFRLTTDNNGNLIVELNNSTPANQRLFGQFLDLVNREGLNLRGTLIQVNDTNGQFIKNIYNSTPELETELKSASYQNGMVLLSLTDVLTIMDLLVAIVNRHNESILKATSRKKASMDKNYAFANIWKVASDPSNIEENMIGLDLATKLAKDLAAQSQSAKHDLQAAPGSVTTKHEGIVEGQVGKGCVSIGAVAIKVKSFTELYYDLVLNQDDNTIKVRLISPEKIIAGLPIVMVDNIFDKTTELTADGRSAQEDEAIRNMVNRMIDRGDWQPDNNVSINMASLLSIAVDNAKDLALAKLNAGPTMINLYDYGLQCGIPLERLEKIINSEAGRIVAGLTLDNSFNNDLKEGNAVRALAFLNGRIFKYLKQWDCVAPNSDNTNTLFSIAQPFNNGYGPDIKAFMRWYINSVADMHSCLLSTKDVNALVEAVYDPNSDNTIISRIIGSYGNYITLIYAINQLKNACKSNMQQVSEDSFEEMNVIRKSITGAKSSAVTPSAALELLIRPYYIASRIYREGDPRKDFKDDLASMISYLSKTYKLESAVRYIKSSDAYKTILTMRNLAFNSVGQRFTLAGLTERLTWAGGFNSLLNWVEDYGKKVKIFNSEIITFEDGTKSEVSKDLWALAEGGEEMHTIGTICSSNKSVPTKQSRALYFMNTITNCINDRIAIIKSRNPDFEMEEAKVDFIQFMTNKRYREAMINLYESVKVLTNPLDMIDKDPNLFKYVEANVIPHVAMSAMSCIYRAKIKYNTDEWTDAFGISSQSDQDAYLNSLEMLLNAKIFKMWAYDLKLQITIPAGERIYKEDLTLSDPITEPVPIELWTDKGLATFKRYMELRVIPQFKESDGSGNRFIKGLISIDKGKTARKIATTAYSLDVDMMPKANSPQASKLISYISDFNKLRGITFQTGTKIPNLIEAFYVYSMYVYNGRKGSQSLMKLFDTVKSDLGVSYDSFLAKLDASADLSLTDEEIIAWCAPLRNEYSTLGQYAYIYYKDMLGAVLSLKKSLKKSISNIYEDDFNNEDDYDEYYTLYTKKLIWEPAFNNQSAKNAEYVLYPATSTTTYIDEAIIRRGTEQIKISVDSNTGKVVNVAGIDGLKIPEELVTILKKSDVTIPALSSLVNTIIMSIDYNRVKGIIDKYYLEQQKVCQ